MGNSEANTAGGGLDSKALFSLFGRAHMLDLIVEIVIESEPPVRFTELQDGLDISPNTLSRRLEELTEAGFLVRNSYDEIPPRVEYEPTEKLDDLEPMFLEFEKWLSKYDLAEEFALLDE